MRFDKERAKRNIETILEKMHGDADIFQLKEYHKLYRKEISFFRRSWAAAWLFMYYDKKETPAPKMQAARGGKPLKPEDRKKTAAEEKTPAPLEVAIPEEESKRLFISIGKNRRLFPREIITLIMSKTQSAREDIGIIKILDNYSFVQVRDTRADEIIGALTGVKFRGRTLTVNYAKPKSESAPEEPGSSPN